MSNKKSIRFFNDHEVRAVRDEENSKWRVPHKVDSLYMIYSEVLAGLATAGIPLRHRYHMRH